jgi:ABC-2 type transport system ATP-binding protein
MSAVIEINDLYRSFKTHFWQKNTPALKGVTLEIQEGEIFGFLGPNGAGKTTTIKILTGLIKPDSGSVAVFGQPPRSREVRKRIGFLPELPYFYDHLSGFELLDLHVHLINLKSSRDDIHELLSKVGLKDAGSKRIRSYSRGMLQRLGCAVAIMGDPDLLILDEPLSGLDPIGRKEIKDLIFEQKTKKKTVFFSSHILPDVEEICDKIGVIIKGQIVRVSSLTDLLKEAGPQANLEDWFIKLVKND